MLDQHRLASGNPLFVNAENLIAKVGGSEVVGLPQAFLMIAEAQFQLSSNRHRIAFMYWCPPSTQRGGPTARIQPACRSPAKLSIKHRSRASRVLVHAP